MEGESKKEDVDYKKQVKVLRAAIKEERKKSAELIEQTKSLAQKLARSDEQVAELIEKNTALLYENKQLNEDLAAFNTVRESANIGTSGTKNEQDLMKLQVEIEKLRKENAQLVKNWEQAQEDQKMILAQSRKNIEEFYEEKAKLEEQAKAIKAESQEEIKLKEQELVEAEKRYAELEEKFKALQEVKNDEKDNIARAKIEVERAEGKVHDLEVGLANKTVYINELNEKLLKQAKVNDQQALKLLAMKNTMLEYEIKLRIYPATEIRKKLKILVNLRLLRNEAQKYALEIAALKEKRQYNILDIDLHLHETNNRCIILSFEKVKDKIEVFECDQATDLHKMFKEFKRLAEEYEEKVIMAKKAPVAAKK